MTTSTIALVRALLGSLACLLTSGCGLLYSYPDAKPEAGAEACSDRQDNDGDGKVDCDDAADCAGFCPEDGARADAATRCTDGIDNDGDGYVDGADPLCWSYAAPQAERCGQVGAALDASFDAAALFDEVTPTLRALGLPGSLLAMPPPGRKQRGDSALSLQPCFQGYGASPRDPSDVPCQAGVTGGRIWGELAGRWADFELEFSVTLAGDGQAEVALVPIDVTTDDALPRAGAELLKVSVAASAPSSTGAERSRVATLAWGAQKVSVEVAEPELCGLNLCDGGLQRFSLRFNAGSFESSFAGQALPPLQTTARAEDFARRARVFVVAKGGPNFTAFVDDLHAAFRNWLPCGFFAPQMPRGASNVCAPALGAELSGATVSLASGGSTDAGYCALVSQAARDARSPATLLAFRSSDQDHWQRSAGEGSPALGSAGDLPLRGAVLRGQAVAWDEAGLRWLAAVSSASSDDTPPELELFESQDCVAWQALTAPAPWPLPADAEAPSLTVDAQGVAQVYFTRPPVDSVGRTLWRSAGGSDDPVPVTELDPELHVDAPVTLQQVGRDFVLVYRLDPSAGKSGLGLAVADGAPENFRKASSLALLEPSPLSGFDDLELLSGAVLWTADGGRLLYGARGSPDSGTTITSAAGTALLRSADTKAPAPQPALAASPFERPGGPIGLDPADFQYVVATFGPKLGSDNPLLYVDPDPERPHIHLQLNRGSGLGPAMMGTGEAWLFRALPPEVLAGDFELSFELKVAMTPGRDSGGCNLSIGVGAGAPVAGTGAAPAESAFADVFLNDSCFSLAPGLVAAVGHEHWLEPLAPPDVRGCSDVVLLDPGAWQQVTLRRQGSEIVVSSLRDTPCGPLESSTRIGYVGTLTGLNTLLMGYSGGPTTDHCGPLSVDLRDLRLRPLSDVAQESR